MTPTHKYHARRTEFNGRVYPSKLQAKCAADIELLRRCGDVTKVEEEVTFKLFGMNGTHICNHRIDFHLQMRDGSIQAWEAKGVRTRDWAIKRKLFEDNFPHIKYVLYGEQKRRYRRRRV